MGSVLVPTHLQIEPSFSYDPFLMLDSRTKELDPTTYSYKLSQNGQYGLDVILGDDLQINESKMSCKIRFADGNSRDGVGDVTEVSGINCDRHRKNPIVLFDHGKSCPFPIALAEDPDSKQYTVSLDPVGRVGDAECFFYQGRNGEAIGATGTKDHAKFCYDIFDMLCRKFIRGGSFAYQIIRADRLQPDYTAGTPPGLHLIQTRLLELGPTVIPAHADTVMKMLDMPGRSETFYKSLSVYAPEKKAMVVGGFEEKAQTQPEEKLEDDEKAFKHPSLPKTSRNQMRQLANRYEQRVKMKESARAAEAQGIPQRQAMRNRMQFIHGRSGNRNIEDTATAHQAKFEHKVQSGNEYAAKLHRNAPKIDERSRELGEAEIDKMTTQKLHGRPQRTKIEKRHKPRKKYSAGRQMKEEAFGSVYKQGSKTLSDPEKQRQQAISDMQSRKRTDALREKYSENAYQREQDQSIRKNKIVRSLREKYRGNRGGSGGGNPQGTENITLSGKRDTRQYQDWHQKIAKDREQKAFHPEEDDYRSLETGDSPMQKGFKERMQHNEAIHPIGDVKPGQHHQEEPIRPTHLPPISEHRSKPRNKLPDPIPQPRLSSPAEGYIKSQPSDTISSEKAKQILKDGTAQGHELTEKQRRMFQAAAHKGEKAYKPEFEEGHNYTDSDRRLERHLRNDRISRRATIIENKMRDYVRQQDANARLQRHTQLRSKYGRGQKGIARCLKKSQPGTFMVYCDAKDLETFQTETGKTGVKFAYVGTDDKGLAKVRLTGLDDAVNRLAQRYGKPGSIAKKGVEVNGDEKAFKHPSQVGKTNRNLVRQSINKDKQRETHLIHQYLNPKNEELSEIRRAQETRAKLGRGRFPAQESFVDQKGDIGRMAKEAVGPIVRPLKRAGQAYLNQIDKYVYTPIVNTAEKVKDKYHKLSQSEKVPWGKGKKGLEHNIQISCPNPEHVIQLAQAAGISAWQSGQKVVLSGIDEVELGRFLRQYKIMDDAQVAVLFGGRLAGHKSLEGGEKGMEVHVKNTKDEDETPEQDQTPADQSEYTPEPEGEEPQYEEGYEDEKAMGEGSDEKLGAQVLRELHADCAEFLEKYDQIIQLVEHEAVSARLMSKLETVVAEMDEIEAEFEKHYPEYEGPGAKDMGMEEGPAPEHEEEGSSSDKLPEPSPDEVVEGMSKGEEEESEPEEGKKSLSKLSAKYKRHDPDMEDIERYRAQRLHDNPKNPGNKKVSKWEQEHGKTVEDVDKLKRESLGDARLDKYTKPKGLFFEHEVKALTEVGQHMVKLGQAKALDEELRMDSWHYSKTLNLIQKRVEKEFGGRVGMDGKKGSLLPAPSGDALEGEDKEADVNKPSGPSHYNPGKEPMQQYGADAASPHMKGSILDSFGHEGGDAGTALREDKDTESHINEPRSRNAVAQPGADKEHMAYGHDGEWPHKGSLLPAPSGDAGEGEPENVHVNKPSSNPQAKPGPDQSHQWFGKPAEWPSHKKNIEEAATYLKMVSQAKDYGEALRSRAVAFSKSFECFNTQLAAVNVTKPSSNPQAEPGTDQAHQPFGKPADWPHKSLEILNKRDKTLAEINGKMEKLKKLVNV